uniref:INO80 complex subunit C n=1 Tax=Gorilla gorilla gorilla TaxID=9595 RepID=A0A2I2YKN0_GORGO
MAAQIPIVATTSTPGIVRNSKKRPASPSHNGSSGGGYGASKKKKASTSSFAQANYTDPQSKLRFSTIEEFSYIRRLPSDVVTGYLALRKATSIVP